MLWRIRFRYVEAAVQVTVLAFLGYGAYLSLVHVGVRWLILHKSMILFGSVYLVLCGRLFVALGQLYVHLCSGRDTHNIAYYPMPEPSGPYQCINTAGDLPRCTKGNCNDKWRPPRSHHCSACGVCRLAYDHHCPWVGNCITLTRLKAFALFLLLIPVAFTAALLPVAQIILGHFHEAYVVSKEDTWAREVWWDWPGSWIVCAGPLGRWIVGTILGFVQLRQQRQYRSSQASLISEPHLRVALVVSIVALFSVFSLVLFTVTMVRVLKGWTTFESIKSSAVRSDRQGYQYNLVCLPSLADDSPEVRNVVLSVPPGERMYDLGRHHNWEAFITQPLYPSETSSQPFEWPQLNPVMLRKMRSIPQSGPMEAAE